MSRQEREQAEDTAVVIAVLSALAGGAGDEPTDVPRELWGAPARRLGVIAPGPHSWWAAGQPR